MILSAAFRPDRLAGKLIRLPLKLLPSRARVPVLKGLNRGRRWRVGASIHGCWLGIYEADKQRQLAALVKPGMVAWDIGANAGFYTLALSRLVGGGGRVYAFEPLGENVANLLGHMDMNRCDNVTLFQLALSNADGLASFQTGQSNATGRLSESANYRVPTATVDRLIDQGQALAPDIVKMDVEGAESRVLEGARELLRMGRTTWLIALHGADQRAAVGRLLTEHGYAIHRIDGERILGGNIEGDEIYALPGR